MMEWRDAAFHHSSQGEALTLKLSTLFMIQNQEKISIQYLFDTNRYKVCHRIATGLSGAERSYLSHRMYAQYRAPVIVIAPSTKEAEACLEDLDFFLKKPGPPLIYFPPYNISPFKSLSYHNETAAKRIRSLYQLAVGETPPLVVTTISAVMQKIIPKKEICNYAELVMTGEDLDRERLVDKLISGGYERSAIVEEPGDFCIRGGILDIFSPLYPDPFRIELFGDTVESLRFFSAVSQRTTKNISEVIILPAREAILNASGMSHIFNRIRTQASKLEIPVTRVRALIHRIKHAGVFSGIESLIPLIYPDPDSFFNYVPENAFFIFMEPAELEKAADQTLHLAFKSFDAAQEEGRLCVEPERLFLSWQDMKEIVTQKNTLAVKKLHVSGEISPDGGPCEPIHFSVQDNADITLNLKHRREQNLFLPLADWINRHRLSGFNTFVVCRSKTQSKRLLSLMSPYGVPLKSIDGFSEVHQNNGQAFVCLGRIFSGFVWPAESLAIITEDEIFGSRHRAKLAPETKARTQFLSYEDLKKGDLVVHVDHGIGQYDDLVELTVNGSSNDFLLIVYKDEDKLYLPVDRMDMVQKYMGVDGIKPVLDKMGGKSWERVKERVKKSTEKIAGELLKLYAERKVSKGHSFRSLDSDFKNFEMGFPYEETVDQQKAIEDVMDDMKSPTPMDRLVCGDVGYGKTEVALRASLLCINDGKQVAVFVPTTVLAEQHFATFKERYDGYPINIACLSRFRSLQEQRKIINDLKSGKIDIVIGTHRLIQKDVVFKDLGLLVLDEEHRFGVKHKEKLKRLKRTVDVLALTATPIPRTLHMSLMGVRDISIISTPPEHRKSIVTYICEFNDAVISDAIRQELDRKGQVFFVHNNIHTIRKMAKHLKDLVPEVRLDVAHGRMDEEALELAMLRFVNKETDLLLCTTIIESGLDISSANTILINRADRFGLAQIYQLRGRVGRLDEQAYAYLFIPKESTLGKDAQKRLKVLMEHSDLGSGFQIAMSDLKIRGGGTILGASQSGHIAAVGYDMFLKLMENSMAALKGEEIQERLEPEININMPALIPESYMTDIDQRLTAYRRLAKMTELKEIADFKAELMDRFGALPTETANLLLKIMLRVLAIQAGVKRIDLKDCQLSLTFSLPHQKNPSGIMDMILSEPDRFEITPDHSMKARLKKGDATRLIAQTKNILKEIVQHATA
jgi:transcription-repair coupling factor (superfamily II helicase)